VEQNNFFQIAFVFKKHFKNKKIVERLPFCGGAFSTIIQLRL